MGTTRMAANSDHGIVDADCRVHGLSNLYIAGSSVFPTVGNDMPTITVVALAHRLADHIKGLFTKRAEVTPAREKSDAPQRKELEPAPLRASTYGG
jgi:choline dehydrogenase-like flavoprotein